MVRISSSYVIHYQTKRTLIRLCCLSGSSGGRGTRASGWFADYLATQQDTTIQSLVLTGGIKGWVTGGDDYTSWMDEYDAAVWKK